MSEFTEFDFRTPEQKIAANNARIQELKNRKAQLEAKRNQMKVASNRARAGDASFVHTMFANEADQANMKRLDKEHAQETIISYDEQLEALDNEIRKAGDPTEKNNKRLKKNTIKRLRARLLDNFPDLETTYVDLGEGKQTVDLDYLEAMYDSMAETWNDEQRDNLWSMVDEYEVENGVSPKTTALKKKIKKTATDTEKETERANANKAIDKALEDVDYVSLQKKGSYTRSVKVNGKLYTVEIKDGVASCNGVKREW
jgi:hydrogenase maturation factor